MTARAPITGGRRKAVFTVTRSGRRKEEEPEKAGGKHTRLYAQEPPLLPHSDDAVEGPDEPVSAMMMVAVIACNVKGEGDRNCLRISGNKEGGESSPQRLRRNSANIASS